METTKEKNVKRTILKRVSSKERFSLTKSSIFTRIMIAGILPTILIFSCVFMFIGNMVYTISVNSETKMAILRAEQATQLLEGRLLSMPSLLNLTINLLLGIDRTSPDAKQSADDTLILFLSAHPDIYNAWFTFEPWVFNEDSRFSKSYIRDENGIHETFDMHEEVLDDPEQSPWYNIPLTTGLPYYNSLNYYDYGTGEGEILSNEIAFPIIQDGEILGCVGFDTRFDESTLETITNMENERSRKIMLIMNDGTIMYSSDKENNLKNIADYSFTDTDKTKLFDAMASGESFYTEGYSPFFDKMSLLCLHKIDIVNDISQPYFYMDIPLKTLHIDADRTIGMIIFASIFSLILAAIIIYIIAKNIVKPIRSITESTNKIANGDNGEAFVFNVFDENKKTNNEVHILGVAIKKMLLQLNETQKLKMEKLELTYKKEKAEMQSQAKGEFLAKMSHEIRTPMNAIIGITELVLREEISPIVNEHVWGIKNAGSNLLSIINDILDFSKIESGKLEITSVEYIFASLINDVINITRIRTSGKQVFFIVNLNSIIPNKLIGDEVRIRQVLINLLSNAVKYTHEGFISMTIDGELQDNNTVLLSIEVEDSGIGIKQDDIEKLFGNFIQVDAAANKGVQGTGLGLAITKSLCQAMGGDISVYSEYGNGSTFTLKIPQKFGEYEKFASVSNPSDKKVLLFEPREIYADSIACSIDNLGVECVLAHDRGAFYNALKKFNFPFIFVSSFLFESAKKIISEVGASSNLVLLAEYGEIVAEKNIKTIAMPVHSISIANILNDVTDSAGYGGSVDVNVTFSAPNARVLIIDDISTNLKVAEGLMAPYNMKIDTCLSGKAGIEMIMQKRYDVIFMDHMMPEMNGIEATCCIRAMEGEYFSSVPIIALTANAISGAREMFLQNGMNDFIAKPIEISKLNSILEQWIPREKKKTAAVLKTKTSSAKFKIEGLDVNSGILATGGNTNHYLTTLSLFCKDSIEKIAQIKNCVKDTETQLFITYVHALKSALASIGALKLSEYAKNLETAAINNDRYYIKQNTDSFLQSLKSLLDNINKTIFEFQKNSSDKAEDKIDKTLLLKLKKSLEEMDGIATDEVIKELQSKNFTNKLRNIVENIYKNILMFEYEDVLFIIDELLSQ